MKGSPPTTTSGALYRREVGWKQPCSGSGGLTSSSYFARTVALPSIFFHITAPILAPISASLPIGVSIDTFQLLGAEAPGLEREGTRRLPDTFLRMTSGGCIRRESSSCKRDAHRWRCHPSNDTSTPMVQRDALSHCMVAIVSSISLYALCKCLPSFFRFPPMESFPPLSIIRHR